MADVVESAFVPAPAAAHEVRGPVTKTGTPVNLDLCQTLAQRTISSHYQPSLSRCPPFNDLGKLASDGILQIVAANKA